MQDPHNIPLQTSLQRQKDQLEADEQAANARLMELASGKVKTIIQKFA